MISICWGKERRALKKENLQMKTRDAVNKFIDQATKRNHLTIPIYRVEDAIESAVLETVRREGQVIAGQLIKDMSGEIAKKYDNKFLMEKLSESVQGSIYNRVNNMLSDGHHGDNVY